MNQQYKDALNCYLISMLINYNLLSLKIFLRCMSVVCLENKLHVKNNRLENKFIKC
jgi:hypothetical protein